MDELICSCWPLRFPCKRCLKKVVDGSADFTPIRFPHSEPQESPKIMAQKRKLTPEPLPTAPASFAIEELVKALEPLDAPARKRVIKAALVLIGK